MQSSVSIPIWKKPISLDILNALSKGNSGEHVGIEFTEIGDSFLTARMPVDRRTTQPWGVVHGGMDVDTGFTEVAEEHKSFNFIRLENGQFACQPNNRCLWYDQSLIPSDVKFPDFQAAQNLWTVDGTRKWSAGDDWFYTIEEKNE